MEHADGLISNPRAYVLTKPGEVYAIYFRKNSGGRGWLDLSFENFQNQFELQWFNPRTGLFQGKSVMIHGGAQIYLGPPPQNNYRDWVALLRAYPYL